MNEVVEPEEEEEEEDIASCPVWDNSLFYPLERSLCGPQSLSGRGDDEKELVHMTEMKVNFLRRATQGLAFAICGRMTWQVVAIISGFFINNAGKPQTTHVMLSKYLELYKSNLLYKVYRILRPVTGTRPALWDL
jgi:hypothetical protein